MPEERRIKGIYAHLNEQGAVGVPFTDKIRYKNPETAVINMPASPREQIIKI